MFSKMKSNLVFLYFLLFVLIAFDFIQTSAAENVKKSVDENRDDNGEVNDESKDESMEIPVDPNDQTGTGPTNSTTCRRQNNQMHEIKAAVHKQFPFMASVMSHQNDHLCSGTVVSNGLILTTAQCTQLAIGYVLVNTTKGKKDETVVALHVIKTEKFPTFTATDSDKDVGLIYTEKFNNSVAAKVKLSNFTSSRNIVEMEVFGFGLNTDVGQTKELQYIGVQNRMYPMHFSEKRDILTGYIDCIDTKVLTCFKDTGGPSMFDHELIGIVVSGDNKCFKEISSSYAVNIKIVDVLPTYTFKAWLEEKIKKHEEQDLVDLTIYPNKPIARRDMKQSVERGTEAKGSSLVIYQLTVMIPCLVLLLL